MARKVQVLIIDKKGNLVSSDDELFSTRLMTGSNILSYFPFLESVFEELMERGEEVIFPGVETKHEFLPGYYDYVFNYNKMNQTISWEIIDATEEYNDLRSQQQNSNEQKANEQKSFFNRQR